MLPFTHTLIAMEITIFIFKNVQSFYLFSIQTKEWTIVSKTLFRPWKIWICCLRMHNKKNNKSRGSYVMKWCSFQWRHWQWLSNLWKYSQTNQFYCQPTKLNVLPKLKTPNLKKEVDVKLVFKTKGKHYILIFRLYCRRSESDIQNHVYVKIPFISTKPDN